MEVVGIDLALEAVFLVVPPQGPEKRKKCKWKKIQRSHLNNSAIWKSWISANGGNEIPLHQTCFYLFFKGNEEKKFKYFILSLAFEQRG